LGLSGCVFSTVGIPDAPKHRHEPLTSQRGHSAAAFSDRARGWRLVGAAREHGDWHRVGARGAVATANGGAFEDDAPEVGDEIWNALQQAIDGWIRSGEMAQDAREAK
jgi:hypothetical protein